MRDGPQGLHILSVRVADTHGHIWMLADWDPSRPGAGVSLWFPNGEVFRELVQQSRLAGEYHRHEGAGGEVVVEVTEQQLDAMIPRRVDGHGSSSPDGDFRDAIYWTEPVFCRRME
jgi:hypothetical protein